MLFRSQQNNQIIWQKVFEKDSINSLTTFLAQQKFTSTLIKDQYTFTGTSNKGKITGSGMPFYTYGDFEAFITIDEKPTRYRVTITNIVFTGVEISVMGATNKSEDALEFYAVKKDGTLRTGSTTTNTLEALNNYFIKTFTFVAPTSSAW